MNANLDHLRRLARLVSPAAGEVRSRTYRSLVAFCLSESKTSLAVEDIVRAIGERFGLQNIPMQLVRDALTGMSADSEIAPEGSRWRLASAYSAKLKQAQDQDLKSLEAMRKEVFRRVQLRFADLDQYDIAIGGRILDEGLVQILSTLGESTIRFLFGREQVSLPDDLFIKVFANPAGNERERKISQEIAAALIDCFRTPEGEFAKGFNVLAQRWVLVEVLQVDPSVSELRRELLQETLLFVDTNILVSLLCKGSIHHVSAREAVVTSRSLSVGLRLLSITREELSVALDWASTLHARWQIGQLDLHDEDNEFLRYYRENQNTFGSWEAFVSILLATLDAVLKEYRIEEVACDPTKLSQTELATLRQQISRHLIENRRPLQPKQVEHDAAAIRFVYEGRAGATGGLGTMWFLTRQPTLIKPDQLHQKAIANAQYPATVSLDTWLAVLAPFMGAASKTGGFQTVLTKLVGTGISPGIPRLSMDSFVNFVAPVLQLGNAEQAALTAYIRSHPLAPTLRGHLDIRDTQGALTDLRKMVQDRKEQDERIRELETKDARQVALIESLRKTNELLRDREGTSTLQVIGDGNTIQLGQGNSSIVNSHNSQEVINLFQAVERLEPKYKPEMERYRQLYARAENPERRLAILKDFRDWLKAHKDTVIGATGIILQVGQMLGVGA